MLIFQYIKYALAYLLIYYVVLLSGAWFLGLFSARELLGDASVLIYLCFFLGIQMIGMGFGWIGYGQAAHYRVKPEGATELLRRFCRAGPFQRTPCPSWQTATVLFTLFFYLGYVPSFMFLWLPFAPDKYTVTEWLEVIPIRWVFALFGLSPLVPLFIVPKLMLPEMTTAEFYYNRD